MFTSAPCTSWSGLQRGSSPRRGPPQTTHWRGDRLQRGVKTHTHDTDGNEHTGGEGGCPPGSPGGSEAASPAGGGSGVSAPPAPPAPPPTGASSVPVRSARAGARRLGPGDDRLLNPLQPLVIIPRWDRCRPRPARSRAAQQAARAASSVVTAPSPAADRRASHTLRGTGPWCLKIGDRRARTPAGAEKGPRWAVPTPTGPEARAPAAAVTGARAPLKGHVSWGPCTAAGLRTDAGHDVQQTRGLSTSDALRHGSRPWSGRRPTVGLAGRRPLSAGRLGQGGHRGPTSWTTPGL